jgi:flagellar export protein FliJ
VARRFRFRLETVLTVRRVRRDAERAEAERASRRVLEARRRARDAELRVRELLEDVTARIARGGPAADAVASLGLLSAAQETLAASRRALAAAVADAEAAAERVRARHRELRVIEALRSRLWLRHRAAEERAAQAEADDAAAARASRGGSVAAGGGA